MPNLTLLDAAEAAKALHQAAQARARTALDTGRVAAAAARAHLADANKELAERERQIAATRALLAAAEVPANAEALVEILAALQVESRSFQAEVRGQSEALAEAEAGMAAATAAYAAAQAAVARAEADVRAATVSATQTTAWTAAATAGELGTLSGPGGDAAAVLDGDDFSAAEDRLAVLPAELLAAARAGFELEADRTGRLRAAAEAAEEQLAAQVAAMRGREGAVEAARIRLGVVERRLRDWVERGRERFDRAVALIRDLLPPPDVKPVPALLTAAELARLEELRAPEPEPEPEEGGEGGEEEPAGEEEEPAPPPSGADGAAEARAARDEKRALYEEARIAYEEARLAAFAPDATVAEADLPGPVRTALEGKRTAMQAAEEQLDQADLVYEAAVHARFAAWSAAVPEAVWRRVMGFLDAERTLNELKATVPGDLVAALDDAVDDLAAALSDEERGRITLAFLEAEVEAREARLERARAGRQLRVLGAVRGDDA
ncbi:MAG: hypothetical protein AB1941_13930 [Gemmatimonadota bacterium]